VNAPRQPYSRETSGEAYFTRSAITWPEKRPMLELASMVTVSPAKVYFCVDEVYVCIQILHILFDKRSRQSCQ